jgi:DNA replication protein DnaC
MQHIGNLLPDTEINDRQFEALFAEVGQYLNEQMQSMPRWAQARRMQTIKARIREGHEPITHPAADHIVTVDIDYIRNSLELKTLHQLTTRHMDKKQASQLSNLLGAVRRWHKDKRGGKAFVLCSPDYGVGKTHIATAVADSFTEIFTGAKEFQMVNGKPNWHVKKHAVIVTAHELMKEMSKADYDHDKFVGNAKCLVIDEVGREGSLKFEKRDADSQLLEKQNNYFELINYLDIRRDVALFITSNLTIEELGKFFNGATWSRLKQMTAGMIVEINNWPDYREVGK